jgi:triose/dihydroxyacetone kinase / FAD-AMP lyase (cyclizing)
MSPIPPLHELIPQLLEMLMSTTDKERAFVPFQGQGKDNVVLLLNNLGGLSELEMGGIVAETTKALHAKGVMIQRVLAGTFMVSPIHPFFFFVFSLGST